MDRRQLFEQINLTGQKIIAIRTALAVASAPIAAKLAELAELKTARNWFAGLPVREGEEKIPLGHSNEVLTFTWTSFYNRQGLDTVLEELQKRADQLQDEIDDFNARTQIEYVG